MKSNIEKRLRDDNSHLKAENENLFAMNTSLQQDIEYLSAENDRLRTEHNKILEGLKLICPAFNTALDELVVRGSKPERSANRLIEIAQKQLSQIICGK